MTGDLPDSVSTIPSDAMSKSLLTVTNGNDALRIAVPGQVVDSAADNVVFALRDSFANTVPYSYNSRSITTCNVEPRWSKTSDRCLRLVFGVLSGDCGVINRT